MACVAFLAALFVGSGGILVGGAYADEYDAWHELGFLDNEFIDCILRDGGTIDNIGTKEGLACIDRAITDVSGIENFEHLQDLTIKGSDITSIDLSHNGGLTRLTLENNNLTSIDLSENTELIYLSLSNNNLDDGDLASIGLDNKSQLKGLKLDQNNFTLVDVSHNPELEDLRLDDIFVKVDLSYEVLSDAIVFDFGNVYFVNNTHDSGNNIIEDIEGVMEYVEQDRTLVVTDMGKTNGYAQTVGTEGEYTDYKILLSVFARTISFDLDDGSGMTGKLTCGLSDVDAESCVITLPEPPAREGYKFLGWATDTEGTDLKQPGEEIEVSEDMELIGIWEKEGEGEGEEEDENEEKDAATPNTGQNTKQGGNATLFVMLALPAVALMAGAGIHAKNLKKSHRKFD